MTRWLLFDDLFTDQNHYIKEIILKLTYTYSTFILTR